MLESVTEIAACERFECDAAAARQGEALDSAATCC